MTAAASDHACDEDVGQGTGGGEPQHSGPLTLLALAALGIVFGDIGTSPLYTMTTVLSLTGGHADRATLLGVLSLLVWTLVIVTTIKYVSFAMRIDNDGEGGILALMALIGIKRGHRPLIVAVGLFGAALIYGDGAITPAISVLSALEGIKLVLPSFDRFILPVAVVVLLSLFLIQPRGTGKIGKIFGPVMLVWFAVIATLGIIAVVRHPSVLVGLSPTYAVALLVHGGWTTFALLGGVFLCVTGAEALYADMGHFGRAPIRLSWFAVVFPALIVNYAGQAAVVLDGAPTSDNVFFRLCPPAFLIPLIILATLATIIASQSIITGAFSMTRQAIHLGWMPRLKIKQTSEAGYGQIYVGPVNWLLMIVTLGLTLGFRKSDNLASAYGIAVSATMLMTSGLLFIAMREVWGWSRLAAGAVAAIFIVVDGAFVLANLVKVLDGGWVPLVLAFTVYGLMRTWHQGVQAITKVIGSGKQPIFTFFEELERDGVARVEGTAVFLTRSRTGTPPLMAWHVRQNRCLYTNVVMMTVVTALVPRVAAHARFAIVEECPRVWRVVVHSGFMERVDFDGILRALEASGCAIDLTKVVYYVAHETIVRAPRNKRLLAPWTERLFAWMERNQAHLIDVFALPSDRVVEIGRHIEL